MTATGPGRADATARFFEELGARGHEPALEKASGALRVELTDGGKQTARWLIEIDKGDVSVSHKNARADCVVRADKTLFDGIANGTVNPIAAVLRGALIAEGDIALLASFQRVFPPPPKDS